MEQKIIIVIVIIVLCIFISSSAMCGYYVYSKKSTPQQTTPRITQQPVVQPVVQHQNQPPQTLVDFVMDTNKAIAWQGMEYHTNQDLTGLGYLISCEHPWNAYYQIGCKLPSGKTMYTQPKGPVANGNMQGPIIRIAPDGENNYCTQLGGTVSILRQRPGDTNMIDITSHVSNSDMSGTYDGIDATFVDNYKMEC